MDRKSSPHLGEQLLVLRRRAGVRQKDLAPALGISPSQLSLLETGKREMTDEMYRRALSALNSIISRPRRHRKSRSYPGQVGLAL